MWTETARRASRETVTVACSRCKAAPVTVQALRAGQLNYCPPCREIMRKVNQSNHYQNHTEAYKADARRRKQAWRERHAKPAAAPRKSRADAAPLASPGQHQSRKPTITVLHDPCEWPLAEGAMISIEEYAAGLRLGAFEPGTVFRMPGGWVEVAGWER